MKNVINQNWNRKPLMCGLTTLFSLISLSACLSSPNGGQKILASDGAPDDFFGFSVAISGDTALVGALSDDDDLSGPDAGSAYVFTRSGYGWKQQAKLTAFDGSPNDTFGGNVALFGDTAVIGASRRDDKGEDSGSAYVFVRSGTTWAYQAKIMASDGAQGDAFGQSVTLLGDTLVVGAPRDDDKGEDSGSAYVFTRTGSTWSQQAKLTAADGAAGDVFGISVAKSGDTILVGADLNDEIDNNAGAAYVYTRSGNSWTQQAKLTASDGGEIDIFGVRVALSGDTALISARRDDTVKGVDAGSAYVFTRIGTSWSQQAKLTAPDGDADDRFGRSVALAGDTAVIGAMFQDDKGDNSGSAYMFTRSGNIWSQKDKLIAIDGVPDDRFGWSAALSGETVIIAATGVDDNGDGSGAAYIYDIARE
ncbi:MAG: FG-GAP repeat protein [Litorimonas sp.]